MQKFPQPKNVISFYSPGYVNQQTSPEGWTGVVCHPSYWVLEYDCDSGIFFQAGPPESPICPWRPGFWNLYRPGTAYRVCYPRTQHPHENLWLLFSMPKSFLMHDAPPYLSIDDSTGDIRRLVLRIHSLQQTGTSEGGIFQMSLLNALMTGIAAAFHAAGDRTVLHLPGDFPADSQEKPEERLLLQVDRIVLARIRNPPSVDELAQSLGMSVSSLSHHFRKESGWTLVERIRYLRIQPAKRYLLVDNSNPVRFAASQLGFRRQQYFCLVFKAVTGQSPTQFLQNFRKTDGILQPHLKVSCRATDRSQKK